MKFAFLGYHVEGNWAAMSKSEQEAMVDNCFAYDSRLLQAGHLIDDGAALQPGRAAKSLRWKNGAVLVTDGPFTETKEQLGGIGMLEVRDMAQAVDLMSQHPGLRYGSVFEIRPVDEELKRQAESTANYHSGAPTLESHHTRFACLGYGREDLALAGNFDEMVRQCIAFDEQRVKSGQWISGLALQGPRTAKTLRASAGKVIVTDGPFAETKEYLGGVHVLALDDLDQAVQLMSGHPALRFGMGIEIRPVSEEFDRRWQDQVVESTNRQET